MPDTITEVMLVTGPDGRALFRERAIPLDQGSDAVRLSKILDASGIQMRRSPIGFQSDVHVTTEPQ